MHRTQYSLILAFGIGDPAPRTLLGGREQWLHDEPGVVHILLQRSAIGIKIFNRSRRHAGVHRRLGNCGGNGRDQSRIEGFRNQVVRAEFEIGLAVRASDDFGLLGLRQPGNGMDCCQLHWLVDLRRAHVQSTTKNEREAKHIVDLVGVVGPTGGNHGIRPHGLHKVR